jgi:hypothetical protein
MKSKRREVATINLMQAQVETVVITFHPRRETRKTNQ